jgi:hypothetical protein
LPEVDLLLVNNIFAFNTGAAVGDPTAIYLGPGVNMIEPNSLYFSRPDAENAEVTADSSETDTTRQQLADKAWTKRTGRGRATLPMTPFPLWLATGGLEPSFGAPRYRCRRHRRLSCR